MTKRNKCDPCRTSKVKCDETEPHCGRCIQKGFNCVRTYGRVKNYRFILSATVREHDALHPNDHPDEHRNVHPTKAVTRAQSKHPDSSDDESPQKSSALSSPRRNPSSHSASLAARWVHMLRATSEPNGEHPIDQFTFCKDLIPLCIGRSNALDDAVACALDMMLAFANRDDEARALVTRVSLPKSVRSVRLALTSTGSLNCGSDLLLAVKMLHLAELFRSQILKYYVLHARALRGMLKQRQGRVMGDLDKNIEGRMFSEMMVEDFLFSIHSGIDGLFDAPEWLDSPELSLETPCGLDIGPFWKATQGTMIQIPRLARLVRAALENPQDDVVVFKALNLSLVLYGDDQEGWVDRLTDLGHISLLPSVAAQVKPVVPNSYSFSSSILLIATVYYWLSRSLVCGLVESLCRLPFCAEHFDPRFIQQQDLDMSTNLAMCIQHGLSATSKPLPIDSGALLMPIATLGFGPWHRLEKRAVHFDELSEARRMKVWFRSMAETLGQCFEFTSLPMDKMEERSDCHAGGPLQEIVINIE